MYSKIVLLSLLYFCDSAKILVVVPTPSYSHQYYFHNLWRELLSKGHHITLISPEPLNEKSPNLTNIMVNTYEAKNKTDLVNSGANFSIVDLVQQAEDYIRLSTKIQFSHPDVKKLLDDRNIHFDLVIFELVATSLVFSWKFKCPSIMVTSMDASLDYNFIHGNSIHPVVNPEQNVYTKNEKMSIKEKIYSILYNIAYIGLMRFKFYPAGQQEIENILKRKIPSLWELNKNISLIMDASNAIFHPVRAVTPNTIHIGTGLHISKPKPLPNDIKDFLDNSKVPVVYFSLGTNVKENLLNQSAKEDILKSFSELPYNFLLKGEFTDLSLPENVKIFKWVPQQDVLRHQNVKLFITQGGLQSLQESVTNSIPMVGIPFFGDQFRNVQKIVQRGIAVQVYRQDINKETMKNAILTILTDPGYKQKAEQIRDLLYDEPMPSLEKAIWWIEYVLRHKGAPLLKSKATHMNI